MPHTRRPSLLPYLLASLLVLGPACGGKSGGSAATATPTARQRLDTAATRLQSAEAFHFLLTHQNGASTIAEGLQMTRAEGDFERPDRFSARVNASFQGLPVAVKVVNVGEQSWITNPLQSGDHFQLLPGGPQTTAILDPNSGLLRVAHDMQDPKLAGSERIGNVDTLILDGSVDAGTLQSVATDAQPGLRVPTRIWIGKDDSLVYRIRIDGPLSASEPKNIARQVDLSAFNEKVDIEPPA